MSTEHPYALGRFAGRSSTALSAVVLADDVVPLERLGLGIQTLEGLLDDWTTNLGRLEDAVEGAIGSGEWASYCLDPATLRPIVPYRPGQIFQSGANYKKHVVELIVAAATGDGERDLDQVTADAVALMDQRADRGSPYVFIGLPSAICGPEDDVILPTTGVQHDWELELAAVIGTPAHHVPRAEAMRHVAAYTIVNDVTTRDRVFRPDMPGLGTDWLAGKNAPTFLPLGPWLVPASHVGDPMDLRITLRLNGETMQDETTADMIFDVAQLIEHVSSITPLHPGDLVLTGSPAGNGAHYGRFLQPDDVLESTITGLGTQRNRCVRS